jgi:uncharacterized protein with HEPN domain
MLRDILEAIRRIGDYSRGMVYDQFVDDTRTQDAVIRNLEIIGEAAKKIPDDVKAQLEQIPWRRIAGTRDRLIHDYFGVNLEIVWIIIQDELPALSPLLKEYLDSIG